MWFAAILLVVATLGMIALVRGNASIRLLADVTVHLPESPPRVSIVVAARDEAAGIEAGLRSLLAQDYPDYEVIVVDDRSCDATPQILAAMTKFDARLTVVRIDELPPNWLGKNHALERGAERASGSILVFADADVILTPDVLSRAVSHAYAGKRDHLALAPDIAARSLVLSMFMSAFTLFFTLYARPWKAPDPRSRCFIGIGAFNLVRTEVYRAVGGHARIALRPDDDIKLGKIIKDAGFSQEMLFGRGLMSVEWYPSLGAVARGLEKNSLAGVDYNVGAMLAGTLAQLAFFVWPFAAFAFAGGASWLLYLATCAVLLGGHAVLARRLGSPAWYAFGLPAMAIVFFVILWRATFITLRDGGINWRGTHYSLAALKSNRV